MYRVETATVISDSCRQSAYEYDLNAMLAMLVLIVQSDGKMMFSLPRTY